MTRMLDLSERLLAAACVAAFAVMFVLGVATVVFRFLLDSSLAFPDEVIRYLFVWMSFLAAAVAYRRGMHAAIGVLVARLPGRAKRGALMLATAASLVFFLVMFWNGWAATMRARPQISPALEVSMSWVYGAIPAGAALLAIYAVELMARQWRAPLGELAEGGA